MRFQNKIVLIVGASGGLGAAFARAFAAEGASLLLTARRVESIRALADELGAHSVFSVDLVEPTSIAALKQAIAQNHPKIDVVINATGVDVRKPFEQHTLEDVERSLTVNLRGAILLTQAFLPLMNTEGVIAQMGGFADGRLAFPYYAADVASRSGLRGFIDSVNREIDGRGVTLTYFSPSPADTDAERPFHPLWQQMGIQIVPVSQVAAALLDAVARKRKVYVMGGWLTRVFAGLNSTLPSLADILIMRDYRRKMQAFFTGQSPSSVETKRAWLNRLGILLIVLSFALYGVGLLVIPFLSIETAAKAALIPGALASGEVAFWVGAAIVGGKVVARYRKLLNPCAWFAHRDAAH